MIKKQFVITKQDAQQRLDKYLNKILNAAPLSFIYKLLRKNDVKVNNKKTTINYIVKERDVVTVYLTEEQNETFISDYYFSYVKEPLAIVYEDENVIVINKARGIPVHQTAHEKERTLTNIVLSYLYDKQQFDPKKRGYIVSPVARIDQETTGIVVFAKKQSVHQQLARAFQNENEVIRD